MELRWVHEDRPLWDEDKQRVIGGAPQGALDVQYPSGAELPGDWWSARDGDGAVVGYGWLDATWGGDAEILLAVEKSVQRRGVGTFILSSLENEAGRRGLNYVYNTVRTTRPDREGVHDWLAVRGYQGSTSDTALRKRTPADSEPAPAAPVRIAPASLDSAMPPGHEESGGYVDIDEHKY